MNWEEVEYCLEGSDLFAAFSIVLERGRCSDLAKMLGKVGPRPQVCFNLQFRETCSVLFPNNLCSLGFVVIDAEQSVRRHLHPSHAEKGGGEVFELGACPRQGQSRPRTRATHSEEFVGGSGAHRHGGVESGHRCS